MLIWGLFCIDKLIPSHCNLSPLGFVILFWERGYWMPEISSIKVYFSGKAFIKIHF